MPELRDTGVRNVVCGENVVIYQPANLYDCRLGDNVFVGPFVEIDLEFTQRLFDEAQGKYYAAQQRYAQYVDQNQALSRRSFRTEEERLQNEMSLAYNLYNQMAQQLQLARAKVQESTPVYAVVQPATVPLKPSKPSKMMILVGCVFLAGAAAAAWLFFGKEFVGAFGKQEETGDSNI